MSDCLLSIVTVTWNCAGTIGKTLASVQAVKQHGIEYIVVDGVSTDGTLEIVRRYDALVDLLVSEPDTGIYNAMNKAVALARGEYVLFINGDDELVTVGFPEAITALRDQKADIVCTTTILAEEGVDGTALVAQPYRLPFFNAVPHPSSFVKTSLLKTLPFREDLRIASDYDFFLQAYLSHRSFRIIHAVTALHRPGGTSSDRQRSIDEISRIRRERLGWRVHAFDIVHRVYRVLKPLARLTVR